MPITAASIRYQDYEFEYQVATGIWRWKTRMDVTGSVPSFQVRDISTPFGLLRDSIPIPGEVAQAMSDSITQIQSNFPPEMLVGPPTSVSFEVDEGRGFSLPETVVLTNTGVFGSLLGASLSVSASYVTVSPAVVGNLASNESGSFDVAVDSTGLLAADSPYSETVTLEDPNATNTPQTLSVTITVRPKAEISASPSTLGYSVSKPIVGPFPAIPSQAFTVENTGPAGSVLDFQVQKLTNLSDDWLVSFSPVTGTLLSGETQTITVAVAPIESMTAGTYQETLRVSGYSSNSFVDVLVQLVIT